MIDLRTCLNSHDLSPCFIDSKTRKVNWKMHSSNKKHKLMLVDFVRSIPNGQKNHIETSIAFIICLRRFFSFFICNLVKSNFSIWYSRLTKNQNYWCAFKWFQWNRLLNGKIVDVQLSIESTKILKVSECIAWNFKLTWIIFSIFAFQVWGVQCLCLMWLCRSQPNFIWIWHFCVK